MTNTLAIDPGIRGCGVAAFTDGFLRGAAYVPSPQLRGALDIAACVAMARAVVRFVAPIGAFQQVVCEWPQIYTPGQQKGDQNDLPPLVGVDCAICAFYPDAQHVTYLPAQWKRQMPKEGIVEARVLERLSAEEQKHLWLPAKHLRHNMYDAVGIGLHHLGRWERFRALAR